MFEECEYSHHPHLCNVNVYETEPILVWNVNVDDKTRKRYRARRSSCH